MDDGYIKYTCHLKKSALQIAEPILNELNHFRALLINKGMIGKIPVGPGFGNLSVRLNRNTFYITGTNTGHIKKLCENNMALVTHVDINKNYLKCNGMIEASSESMSHYVIYKKMPAVNAVIHIHHKPMWDFYKDKLPTTPANILYGTPEMAYAIAGKLLSAKKENVLILGGHEDGIISFGTSLSLAYNSIDKLFTAIC